MTAGGGGAGTALILGATSEIGTATAKAFAARGYALQLAARDPSGLERVCAEIDQPCTAHPVDVRDPAARRALLDGLRPLPDIAVCLIGGPGDHGESLRDPEAAAAVIATNFTGPAQLLGELANRFEARGTGAIAGVSSVVGERGRARNYVYGAAKAGFTAFLGGLRHRLVGRGVHVATIKAGWVRTNRTPHAGRPRWLTAAPEQVAEAIVGAVARRRDVVYVRRPWRLVMLAVRAIPEPLFKRLSI